jgi:hypothetical protein
MRWFRSHIRFGSRLALVALAIQFLLTFSHIDNCDLASAAAATASVVADAAGTPSTGKGSPVRKSDRTADQTCPICALIQLAATSTPSTPPVLAPPARLGLGRIELPTMAALAAVPPHHFRARAPPIA